MLTAPFFFWRTSDDDKRSMGSGTKSFADG